MLNKWIGMGRLVKSPDLRNTPSGVDVATFTIACERDFKGQDGEKITDYIDIVAWRQKATFAAKYFEKGRMVVVEGRLQMRDYTDKDGNKRRVWEVVAENLYFADSKRPESNVSNGSAESDGFTEIDDDGPLPF